MAFNLDGEEYPVYACLILSVKKFSGAYLVKMKLL